MVDLRTFKEAAVAFDKAVAQRHFDKPSYRIKKRTVALNLITCAKQY